MFLHTLCKTQARLSIAPAARPTSGSTEQLAGYPAQSENGVADSPAFVATIIWDSQ